MGWYQRRVHGLKHKGKKQFLLHHEKII